MNIWYNIDKIVFGTSGKRVYLAFYNQVCTRPLQFLKYLNLLCCSPRSIITRTTHPSPLDTQVNIESRGLSIRNNLHIPENLQH